MSRKLLAILLCFTLLISAVSCTPTDPFTDDMYVEGTLYIWDGVAWTAVGTGTGNVTSPANIADHSVLRGDGGALNVQDSLDGVRNVTINDFGTLTTTGDVVVGQDCGIGNDCNITNDLDVTDNAAIGGNLTVGQSPVNYLYINDDGTLTLYGTGKVINELWIDAGGIKAPGAKPATAIAHGILEVPAWQFADQAVIANQESVSWTMRIPECMDRTVAPTITIGWSSTTTSQDCKWQLEYLWRSVDEGTTVTAQGTIPVITASSAVAEGLAATVFSGLDLASATDVCIHCRLTRLSASLDDTISDTVEMHGICMLWTSDKLGS